MFAALLRRCRSLAPHGPATPPRTVRPRLDTLEAREVPAFLAATDYGGRVGDAVVVADFNGDNKLDLASVGNTRSHPRLTVQLGNGSGGFGITKITNLPTVPQDMAVADLDRDGKTDLVTTSGGTVTVLLGKGTGLFRAPNTFALTHSSSASLVVADFDGDGKPDVAVTGVRGTFGEVYGVIDVLRGSGTGALAVVQSYTLPRHPITGDDNLAEATATAVGDFNGDARPDLAVSFRHYFDPHVTNGSVYTLTNAGGSLAAPAAVGLYGGLMLAVGDMNGDGRADLVTRAGVSLGAGNGTFQPPLLGTLADLSDYEDDITLADFNGDGRLDVATTTHYFLGNGDGTVRPGLVYASFTPNGAFGGVAVGDFNGDGRPDLAGVVGGNGSYRLRVALNDGHW